MERSWKLRTEKNGETWCDLGGEPGERVEASLYINGKSVYVHELTMKYHKKNQIIVLLTPKKKGFEIFEF